MKVDLTQIKTDHKRDADAVRQISMRAAAILFVLVSFFIIAVKLSEPFAENYLLSHFLVKITPENRSEKITLPSENFTAILDLDTVTHENFLEIGLSGSDIYKVSFLLGDTSDFIIISTKNIGDTQFLHLIPNSIVQRGYERVEITPLEGNWDYWLEDIALHNDPNPANYPDHKLIDFEIKKLEIEVDEDGLAQLERKAQDAYDLGILLTEEEDYVPAIVRADGKKDDAEIRLKGDWTDHLEQGKWSFRIKMDVEAPWGMTKFSIHRPETRNGISEYLIQKFFREQGGIALRYDFADVLINGEYIGVYALEEFFDKRLIEDNLRREGPIIKVNEDYLWERRAFYSGRIEDWDFGLGSENGYMDFDVFSINKTLENPALRGYAAYGITALNKLLTGEVEAEDIFDLELYAKFFATLDVFNSCHGNIWHNFRFYVNPVTGKLEPITFDNLPKAGLCESSSKSSDPLITPFFENQAFARMYVQYVRQFLEEYDGFLEKESENLQDIALIFERDDIFFEDFTTHLDELHYRISSTIDIKDYDFRLEQTSENQLLIKIDNPSYLKIQLNQILYDGGPVEARFTDNIDRIAIIQNQQPDAFNDLNKFSVVYTTLEDGEKHIKSVTPSQFEFAFYAAGHVYGSHDKAGTAQQDEMHPPFASALPGIAENTQLSFGFLTGDTVYIPSQASYGNLKDAMALTAKPYYIAPGNHDLDGSGLFTENFGPIYQSFTQGKSLFIILTPRNDWELNDEQLSFLEKTLREYQDQVFNIFIITHYLFWLDGEHFTWITSNGGPYPQNQSNFWTDVIPLVEEFDGDIYFIAGDVGAFTGQSGAVYERASNIHFIASGMGGGTEDNYLIVKVFDDSGVEFELVPISLVNPQPLGRLTDR